MLDGRRVWTAGEWSRHVVGQEAAYDRDRDPELLEVAAAVPLHAWHARVSADGAVHNDIGNIAGVRGPDGDAAPDDVVRTLQLEMLSYSARLSLQVPREADPECAT